MDIAIIGAGNVGRALAGATARAGHTLAVSSAGREGAQLVAKETGARAAESNRAAIEGADVVVLAVPYPTIDGILGEIADALTGKVVIDVTNPLKPDYSGLATEGTSAAEQIQARVGGARVMKAFNTVFASRLSDPVADGVPLDALVAGDDEVAKRTVLELVEGLGFRPIDAGPITMARALEWMGFLNISLQIRNEWSWQTSWKLIGPTGAAA